MLVEPLFDKARLAHGQVRRLTSGVWLLPKWDGAPPIVGTYSQSSDYVSLSSEQQRVKRLGVCDNHAQVLTKYPELEWSPIRKFSLLLYPLYRNDHSQEAWSALLQTKENYLGKLTPSQASVVFVFCICEVVTYMYSWQYDTIAKMLSRWNSIHLTNEGLLEGSSD